MDLLTLIGLCAPVVSPPLMKAVVLEESRGNPHAIYDGGTRQAIYPSTEQQAIETARKLLSGGSRIDAGLAQISSANWEWLGLTVETVFDPCTNLQAGERVLLRAYLREPHTRDAAISRYNTGHPERGVKNGYVARVKGWLKEAPPRREYKSLVEKQEAENQPEQLEQPAPQDLPATSKNSFRFQPVSDGFSEP